MNLPFFIARRSLLKQKGAFSSFIIRLAIVATALSVAVMILSVAIISGFKYAIREKLFSFWGHIHVAPYNANPSSMMSSGAVKTDTELIRHIQAMPHVVQVAPYALSPGIIQAKGHMEGIKLKGIEETYRFAPGIGFTGQRISYADTAYSHQLQLSQTTADRLDVHAGDSVFIYFLEPGAKFPRVRKMQVAGIYHTGLEEVDHYFAICDLRLLQRINGWPADGINGYQVDIDNDQLADTLAEDIRVRYVEPPLTTYPINSIFPNIFDWLRLQDVNARIILSIMAVVVVINLAVALVILIVEQAKMVGLLKALGMSQGSMQQVFLYHTGIIAGVGILAGNVLSLGLCWLQQRYGFMTLSESTYYMKEVPVRINWWQVATVDICTLVLCVLCMWLPSLYIRRIMPARVLQFK